MIYESFRFNSFVLTYFNFNVGLYDFWDLIKGINKNTNEPFDAQMIQ